MRTKIAMALLLAALMATPAWAAGEIGRVKSVTGVATVTRGAGPPAALKPGQTASLRVPAAVCAGVVRSKVEIQALAANSPNGTPAGTIGEYDLRC